MVRTYFDHEKLRVYQEALRFVGFADAIIAELPPKLAARDQLDRASTSIVLNIAEGNGKRSRPDRGRYLDAARGSALECAACLDVLRIKSHLTDDRAGEGKELLIGVVSMLIGLLDSLGIQLNEDAAPYETAAPADHD